MIGFMVFINPYKGLLKCNVSQTLKGFIDFINPLLNPLEGFMKGFITFLNPFIYPLEGFMIGFITFLNPILNPLQGFRNVSCTVKRVCGTLHFNKPF